MDVRKITESYSVSPQIEVGDLARIAEAGFTTVICNRPDEENPANLQAAVMAAAARDLGLDFQVLPLTHQTMTPDNIARQRAIIEGSEGPALAYCASGTRSTIAWALGQAGDMPADDILLRAVKAGYDLERLRPALSAG
ncbi:MAG: TIGR01244 family phosphatase [Rhodobacteraceae bacterium]|nr:TIGR01244 family phosphatase [Paracoccaceae bacterium]MAY44734.1 TIGR01244 family phosphatase [Paracoccaceae bacterium]